MTVKFYWWRKLKDSGKTTDLQLVTDKHNYMRLYGVQLNDKSNYCAITDMIVPVNIENSQVTTQCNIYLLYT